MMGLQHATLATSSMAISQQGQSSQQTFQWVRPQFGAVIISTTKGGARASCAAWRLAMAPQSKNLTELPGIHWTKPGYRTMELQSTLPSPTSRCPPLEKALSALPGQPRAVAEPGRVREW